MFLIRSHMGSRSIDATFKLPGQAVSSARGDPPDHSAMHYTSHQGSYFAHRITLDGLAEDVQSLSTARVDLNPHQVDVALFALSSPLSKGALLADEATSARRSKRASPSPSAGASASAISC